MFLTIAIPTYNRVKSLQATLLKFISQIELQALTEIEILISDNCSTDNTTEICARIAFEHPTVSITYIRNETNIGFDRNVDNLFRYAKGFYVWTFSDDDEPGGDALAKVIGLLRQREVRFAFVNYEVSVTGVLMKSRYGVGESRWLKASDLLKEIRFSNSLISSCIFQRDAWIQINPQQHFDTLWIHFFVARDILLQGSGLIIGQPLFKMVQSSLEKSRAERNSVSSQEIEFFMLAHLKFIQFSTELAALGYDRSTCALAESLGQREDIYQVINFKLTVQNYNLHQLRKTWSHLFKYRASTLMFWLVVTPLLFVPNQFVKLLRTVARRLR